MEFYRVLLINYSTADYPHKMNALKAFFQATDIYGRMLIPSLIYSIDNQISCINEYMTILYEKRYGDLEEFYVRDLCDKGNCDNEENHNDEKSYDIIKEPFLTVNMKKGCYCIDDRIASLGILCNGFFKEVFPKDDEENIRKKQQIICEFSDFFLSKKLNEPNKLIRDNINIIHQYLNYCSGYTAYLRYANHINCVQEVYYNNSQKTMSENIYAKIKTDIDSAIAHKWTEEMFSGLTY